MKHWAHRAWYATPSSSLPHSEHRTNSAVMAARSLLLTRPMHSWRDGASPTTWRLPTTPQAMVGQRSWLSLWNVSSNATHGQMAHWRRTSWSVHYYNIGIRLTPPSTHHQCRLFSASSSGTAYLFHWDQPYLTIGAQHMWRDTCQSRERFLLHRLTQQAESRYPNTRPLPQLQACDTILIQNQSGPNPKKWDRARHVVEVLPHDQCL